MRTQPIVMHLLGHLGLLRDIGAPKPRTGPTFYSAKEMSITIGGVEMDMKPRSIGFSKHQGSVRARRHSPKYEMTLEMTVPWNTWAASAGTL